MVGVLPQNFEMPTLTPADVLLPEALNEAVDATAGRCVCLKIEARHFCGAARVQLQPFFERLLQTVPPAFPKEVSLRAVRARIARSAQTGLFLWRCSEPCCACC